MPALSLLAATLATPAPDPVLQVVSDAHLPTLDRCEADGRLSAAVGVEGGEVVAVALVESDLEPAAQRCVLAGLFGWRFPAETTRGFSVVLDFAALPPLSAAEIDAVGRVVRAGSGQLRRCYEQALNTDPTLAVSLQATLGIVDGAVDRLAIGPGPGTAMHDCLDRRLRSWRFPEEISGEVVLPLAFSPG